MRRIFLFLVVVAQLGLALSPFIPFVRDNIWIPQTSVSSFSATLATYIGVQFLCLATLIYLSVDEFKQSVRGELKMFGEAVETYTPLQVRALRENQFYKEFLGHCVKAEKYVNICYFAPLPPTVGGSPERIAYYKNIARVMKTNAETRFRRLVRDTPENRAWIPELVRGLAGAPNCYVSLISDLQPEYSMPLALSVQIVDGTDAWLVAISEHTNAAVYRDVGLHNIIVVEALSRYFDRLWAVATPVYEPGYELERTVRCLGELR